MICSGYGCFFHFYLILTNSIGFKYFSFIGGIFFINFTLTDYRFLDIIWRIKNKDYINNYIIFRKRTVRFYILSYLVLFFMLIFMDNLIFNIYLSILYIILTWLPQIIYNSYYYNRTSLPYSYIIINSLLRLFPSLYFFLNKDNFMFIPQNTFLEFFNIFIMLFLIIIMQCQIHIGPRFFLPDRYNKNIHSLYKTKIELINQNKNLPNECCICLGSLLIENIVDVNNINNTNTNIKNFSNNSFKENNIKAKRDLEIEINTNNSKNVIIEEHDNNINVKNNILIIDDNNKFSLKNILKTLILYLKDSFNFFTKSNNIFNKEYIVTPCNHVFHSKCLEKWFERKKECPFCRKEFDYLI